MELPNNILCSGSHDRTIKFWNLITKKEVNTIIYLFNIREPVSINELQEKVWGYQSELETHTVETHIYRLRKKINEKFNDNNFIKSNEVGYFI